MHFLENGMLSGESLGELNFQSDAQIYKKRQLLYERKIDINYLEKNH